MKKLMTLAALLSITTIGWAGSGREATADRLDHAGRVLHEIMAAPDRGIPEEVLEHAKCIAVVQADGAHRHSSLLPAEAGDCRLASKVSTWSLSSRTTKV